MPAATRMTTLLTGVVLLAALVGCASLNNPAPDTPSSAGTSEAESFSGVAESDQGQEAERAYYDNVVLLQEFSDEFFDEGAEVFGAPSNRGSWDQVDESDRKTQIDAGLAACERVGQDATDSTSESNFLQPWLAATFLCKDKLDQAKKALTDEYSEQVLQALEFSLLKGDTPIADVTHAVDLCSVTIDNFYDIKSTQTPGYFCWILRANVNAEQEDEDDFLFLFRHTDAEQAKADAEFDEWVQDMGAKPNFLGDLANQERDRLDN